MEQLHIHIGAFDPVLLQNSLTYFRSLPCICMYVMLSLCPALVPYLHTCASINHVTTVRDIDCLT